MRIQTRLRHFYRQLLSLTQAHPHVSPILFFVGGVFFDYLTLGYVDDWGNLFAQIFYLSVLTLLIPRELHFQTTQGRGKIGRILDDYHIEIFHFCLGALLSAYTFFYLKSANFSSSFLFIFLLVALLILNETPLVQRQGLILRSALFMFCLYSFCLVMTPTLIGMSGVEVFALSNFVFLILAGSLSFFFLRKSPLLKRTILKDLAFPAMSVCLVMSLLYITRIIPPVPLSTTHIGIYHGVEKNYPSYKLKLQNPWWKFWNYGDQDFRAAPGDKVYTFFRIFSPGGYEDQVKLRWMRKINSQWKTSDVIPLTIEGGRREGYRGYAYKSNYAPGEWKVRLETPHGLVISQLSFEITQLSDEQVPENRDFRFVTDR